MVLVFEMIFVGKKLFEALIKELKFFNEILIHFVPYFKIVDLLLSHYFHEGVALDGIFSGFLLHVFEHPLPVLKFSLGVTASELDL